MKQHPCDLHVGVDSSSNPRRSQTDDVKTGRNLIEETRMSCATQRVSKPTFLNLSSLMSVTCKYGGLLKRRRMATMLIA